MNVVEAKGLGYKYSKRWALQDCSLNVPAGQVVALVGPNGAGKTTLLQLAAGLLSPSSGSLKVLGKSSRENPKILSKIGFVAQDKPLYKNFKVSEMLRYGASLNPEWDQKQAEKKLEHFKIPLSQKAGDLSGGQQAQVALTLALAKKPELLLLDEPVANLDPLARQQFMQMLMEEVAESGATAVLSSHLVSDLKRVCDYLILLSASRVQLAGPIDELLDEHSLLIGPKDSAKEISQACAVIGSNYAGRQATLLVRGYDSKLPPNWRKRSIDLEELIVAYMGSTTEAQVKEEVAEVAA